MPLSPPTFHLLLAPGRQLVVTASDVASAIAAARDAMTFLQPARASSERPDNSGEEGEYLLTCLLCHATSPQREGKSPLVTLQEHLIEEHGLPVEALRSAVRVCEKHDGEEVSIWTMPEAVASLLGMSRLSYMRESLSRPAGESSSGNEGWRLLVSTRRFEAGETRQEVSIVKEDAHAWYGYPRGALCWGEPLIWPRGEWVLVR